MPIYEYQCEACLKRTSQFVRSIRNPEPARCGFCQSARLTRLISRVATPKSEEARLDALADPANLGGFDENDPQSMARWMKQAAGEMGEDVDEDMMADLEAGSDSQTSADSEQGSG